MVPFLGKSYARFNLFSTREQALALPGIGKALADKIMEMVEVGRIRKVETYL